MQPQKGGGLCVCGFKEDPPPAGTFRNETIYDRIDQRSNRRASTYMRLSLLGLFQRMDTGLNVGNTYRDGNSYPDNCT